MIKAMLISLGVGLLLVCAYALDLFEILATRTAFWIAFGMVVASLTAAVLVLGIPTAREEDDDSKKD